MENLMAIVTAIILSAGIPSAVFALLLNRYIKRMDERDAARVEKELVDYRADKAHFALGEECALAVIRGGTFNGELKEALKFSRTTKHEQQEFWVKEGARK